MANWYIDVVAGISPSSTSVWSSVTTYNTGDRCYRNVNSMARVYVSLQDSNTNHAPGETDDEWWEIIADGSNTLPYAKEADVIASGMVAGDEYRHAKGPARTDISVNLSWTNGSTSVVATGTDVTGEIAAGDWICKASSVMGATETVYRVASLSYSGGNTTIVLSWKYYGTTEIIASQKIGVIDCGTVASSTVVHYTQKDGTSGSPILHTGGWTLATETRDGETYYLQSNATIGGYCFSTNGKDYNTYQYLGCLRFGRGFAWSSTACDGITITDCIASGGTTGAYVLGLTASVDGCALCGNSYGIYCGAVGLQVADTICLAGSSSGIMSSGALLVCTGCICNYSGTGISATAAGATLTSCIANSCSALGISISNVGATLTSCTCNSNTTGGIYCAGAASQILSCTCSSNGTYGIRLLHSNCLVSDCTCSSNGTGVQSTGGDNCVVTNLTAASNSTANLAVSADINYGTYPMLSYQRLNGVDGAHGTLYEYGTAVNDEASERTAGQSSIKVTPTSATYGCDVLLAKAVCVDGTGYTFSIYAKDDADHNGGVSLYVRGPLATITDGPTEQALTTSWAQYTITIDAADVPDDGIIELYARVTGTAGNVWFADPGVS